MEICNETIEVFRSDLHKEAEVLKADTTSSKPEHEAFAKACCSILLDSGALVDEPEFPMINESGVRLDAICWPEPDQPIIEFLAFIKQKDDSPIEKEITHVFETTLPILKRLCSPTAKELPVPLAETIVHQIFTASPHPESILLRIITDAKITKPDLEKKLRQSLKRKLQPDIHTDFKLCDITTLCMMNGGGQSGPVREFTPEGPDAVQCVAVHQETDHDVYLAAFPGKIIASIFKEYGQQVLQKNVRAFLGMRGKKNQKIAKTLRERPQKFLAFNNGLTITVSNIELGLSGLHLAKVEDMQIVNGGQTTAVLANEFRQNGPTSLDTVKVFAKIIHVKNEDQHLDWIEQIAETSNTQNAIKDADLSSHNPIFIAIKELSQKVNFRCGVDTVQWYFSRVRNEYKVEAEQEKKKGHIAKRNFEQRYPKERVIEKSHIARAENIFCTRPWAASRGEAKCHSIFLTNLPDDFVPDDEWFKIVIGKIITIRKAEELAKQMGLKEGRSCIVEYACSLLAQENDCMFHLAKTWKSQQADPWTIEKLDNYISYVNQLFRDMDKDRSIKEHAKKESTWQQIVSQI